MSKTITEFSGRNRFLSNFYKSPMEVEGVRYPTVEHFYQAQKTLDAELRKQIADIPTPSHAKRHGRTVWLRPGWENIKNEIMLQGLRLKFVGTPLATLLLNTGDAELIEGNTWGDTYWGVCNGVGENMLGKLLMQVRDEIRKEIHNEDVQMRK